MFKMGPSSPPQPQNGWVCKQSWNFYISLRLSSLRRFCKHNHVILQLHSESNTWDVMDQSSSSQSKHYFDPFYSNNESPHTEHTRTHDIFLNTDRHRNGVFNIRIKIRVQHQIMAFCHGFVWVRISPWTCGSGLNQIGWLGFQASSKKEIESKWKICCTIHTASHNRNPLDPFLYLLCYEVQPALQSVGHFDLPISIIQLNTTRATQKTETFILDI